jgi:SAM-dependent methyltransferase
MFIDNSTLFGSQLEGRLERTNEEVEGLIGIFSEHTVPSNGKILDLACGIGRHSIFLAEKGYRMVGIDISPDYIKRAEELAAERGISNQVEFIIGDMRDLESHFRKRKFDAVVNLFTSHGYWDDNTDKAIFSQACKVTKNSGLFVIQTANRDFLVKHFQARDVFYDEQKKIMIAERRLDFESSRMYNTWKYYKQQEQDLIHLDTFEFDHRVYSLHELIRLIENAGWKYLYSARGFNLESMTSDALGMIVVASKE